MNEAETRADHIDPALKAAGWGVVEGSRVMREYRITEGRLQGAGQRSKPEIADYVLVYRNHKLAVVEAKRWDLPYTEGLAQAKTNSSKLRARFGYATNGQRIYGVDMQSGAEGEINAYPSPQELWNQTFAEANDWRERFAAVPFEDKGGMWGSRYYQDSAINAVLEAIADNQQRILLTLATGTGKTFIAFQLAWKLFHARWNLSRDASRRPRILFLADRNILADQAYNSFSAFPEDALVRIAPEDIRKKGRVPKNGSVFFTIFQTFMSGPPKDGHPSPYFGEYPPDFFDFIVIDECHRGGANDEGTWRGILEYFAPAVQLGLTATPKVADNVNTYDYFGEPVYVYSLKEGINDGFLTPFRVKQYATTLDEYVYTSDDNLVEGEIEAGKRYEEKDFNRIIEIEEREKYRVQLFMEAINQREKTLVFCANQAHALAVRDLINQMKSASTDPNYCVRVTANDGERGEQYLREFQDNEKSIPTVLTTSQKLSTGVDARNVRNIVLMRPINSMIEFKQIIGRGTRLYDGKDYFTIFDFVKAHEKFNDPGWDGPVDAPEPCKTCGRSTCVCVREPQPPCYVCGQQPCVCEKEPCRKCGQRPCVCKKVRVKLADGKERNIQHIAVTTFWGEDGKPLSAAQFLELLFGHLPEFFKDEDELRALWSLPDTRKKLLEGLAEKASAEISYSRCRRSSMRRRAICSMCWRMWHLLCSPSRVRSAPLPLMWKYMNSSAISSKCS
jgi:type I restriction enzyme R subunit